ncbi:MAG: AmmeMemoRadiSam system protein A [Terriglobales bacterium]
MCPSPDDRSSRLTCLPGSPQPDEFSSEERALLLRLAHEAIAATFDRRDISLLPPSAHLAELRGVFATLYYQGSLRGCVGYILPVNPLYRTVAESARGAAFDDSRFSPVTPEEAPELQVSLSVLTPPRPIQPEQVEIGRHGLLITLGPYRGLLLPQVPAEHGWDRVAFLEQTCRKAGLPRNAWQTGAKLEAFTAEIFADPG